MRCFEMKCIVVSMVAVAVLIAFAATPVSAAIVVYTDETTFEAALSSYYQEWFHGYGIDDDLGPSIALTDGSYSYTISASDGLYGLEWPAEPGAISNNQEYEAILFTPTGSSVTAAGGYFFGTMGDFVEDTIDVTVQLSDASETSYETGAAADDFLGFISTSLPITSLTVSSEGYTSFPTIDGFIVGTPVPEPGTLALLAAGLAGLLCYAWRKRK